jgi:predicted nucleic acid-binding protein
VICIDTSSLIAFLEGESGPDVDLVAQVLRNYTGILAPVTVSEVLSDPKIPSDLVEILMEIPVLPLTDGYWARSGRLRALARRHGRKANLPDTLIAQCCLDNDVPLITRDGDFEVFSRMAALVIL